MRAIDADALVRELTSLKVTFGSGNGLVEGGLGLAISTTNGMPTIKPEQQWIPVTERLPSNAEDVLLTECVHYTDGRRRNRTCTAYYDYENKEWLEVKGDDVEIVSYPVAWQPLPEPYREEGN